MGRLPAFIADSYKRYKSDTNRLVKWLVVNSRKLGLVVKAKAAAKPARLKGRDRKLARESGTQKPSTGEARPCILTVDQISDMAKLIADAKVAVPASVLVVARRAIKVRKSCAQWFSRAGRSTKKLEKDGGHWHFIEVLETVLSLLLPLKANDAVPSKVNETADVPLNSFRHDDMELSQAIDTENKFAALDMEDVNDDFDASQVEVDEATMADKETYEVENEDDSGELLFAIFSLFQDLHNIREFLQQTWAEFRDGTIDLISASVTTNTAIDLVRDIQDDISKFHPEVTDYDMASKLFYLYACMSRGEDPTNIKHREDIVNLQMIDVAEFLYMPIHSNLESLAQVIQPNQFPWYNGQFGKYNPLAKREGYNHRERLWEDRLILMEAMPELVLYARFNVDDPLKDEFTKEFGEFARTKKIPLVLVFATQIFIDIHHILRERAGLGATLLRLAGSRVEDSLKKSSAETPANHPRIWPKDHEDGVKHFQSWINVWIINDRLKTETQRLISPLGIEAEMRPFSLYNRHPMLCGLILFKLQLHAQHLGMVLASAWGSIIYTAHLYEACKYSHTLNGKEWKDMEFVMAANGKERMFKGRVPTNPTESLKSFNYMVGWSPLGIAGTDRSAQIRKRGPLKGSAKGPTGLEENSPISILFRDRICYNKESVFTVEAVDRLLRESIKTTLPYNFQRSWSQAQKMTPLQLLVTLRAGLFEEKHKLRFDYIRMHTRCQAVLRQLHEELDPIFTECFGSTYMENEGQLAWIAGWVFLLLAESDAVRGKTTGVGRERIMAICGEVMEKMTDVEGDYECKALARC
ncbi:uncharacterized protein EV422DRAFT_402565 [Fimicolochytrium jonesii]|uniref:uncharacterized protein n=1 Tax=Fimicolochytrium jonesii TaxID=1396493 RepID=UPI0022FE2EDD|nr:uncharacterized protein EV422DRAFT_402565 [Fimicolochytrium jonesii]KAI8822529.1 hypothetical protein EV422DRAFT_402565 [Fimicolochytrium jonesii]